MESKKKFWCMALAAVLVCAGLVTVFSLPRNVGAGDVGGTVLEDIGGPITDFRSVEWHPDAGFGMAVGWAGNIYRIDDPGTVSFSNLSTDFDDMWYDLTWNGTHYIICGYNTTDDNVQAYDGVSIAPLASSGAGDTLHAVAYGSIPGQYLFAGVVDAADGIHYYNGTGFNIVTGIGIPAANDFFTDIAYDPVNGQFVIVGGNLDSGIIYYVNETSLDEETFDILKEGDTTIATLNAIAWNGNYGLAVGAGAGVYKVNETGAASPVTSTVLLGSDAVFNDVALITKNGMVEGALIIGQELGDGLVLRYQDNLGGEILSHASAAPGFLVLNPLQAVAFKDYGSPRYGIMLGSTTNYKYNAIEASAQINVNINFPQIEEITLYRESDPTNTSLLGQQIDVDPGTGDIIYILNVSAYHNDTWDVVGRLEVQFWHNSLGDYDNLSANNNSQAGFQFNSTTYLNGVQDSYYAPAGVGEGEIELLGVTDVRVNDTHHNVLFKLRFNRQVWSGLNPEWNINVTIWDKYDRGNNSRYENFGIYKYTELSASGIPPDQTGGGPPGVMVYLREDNQTITFSANTAYNLTVWVTDLLRLDGFPEQIGADNLGFNTSLLADFQDMDAGAGYENRKDLTGAIVTSDSGNDTILDEISWRCFIPAGLLEGNYYGTMTFVLEQM